LKFIRDLVIGKIKLWLKEIKE
jgi:hypothetical protein